MENRRQATGNRKPVNFPALHFRFSVSCLPFLPKFGSGDAGLGRNDQGTGLLELVVGLAFAGLFAVMLHQFSRSMLYGTRVLEIASEGEEAVRVALHVITRDMRDAGFSADGSLGNGIRIARSDAVEVVADRNEDGDTDDANERVGYSIDAATRTLRRSTGGAAPQPFLPDLAPGGVSLAYFDADGTFLAADGGDPTIRARIRRIDVTLRVELPHPDPASPAPIRVAQSGSVALRNE